MYVTRTRINDKLFSDIADETADTKLGLESELVDVTRVLDEAATDVVERSEGGTAENLESTLIEKESLGLSEKSIYGKELLTDDVESSVMLYSFLPQLLRSVSLPLYLFL